MAEVEQGVLHTETPIEPQGDERGRASIPWAVGALVLAVVPLAAFALPFEGAGFIAPVMIAGAVVLAIVAVAKAVRRDRGRVLAVVALALAVTTGTFSSVASVALGLANISDDLSDSGVVASNPWADVLAGDDAAPVGEESQISAQWVVDELLRECRADHLHAVAAPGSTTLYLVGERPVSVDDFTFTVTVEPGDDTWNGIVQAGSEPLEGSSANPLGCENVELDAETGAVVTTTAGGDEATGSDAPPASDDEVSYWDLEIGMCLNDANLTGRVTTIPLVDCDQPHDSEVYAIEALADGPYPGDDEVFRLADEVCLDAYEPYVGMDYDISYYYFGYYWPDKNNWGSGDRNVVCVIYDENGQIEGSVRGSGR